ncbi:MAG: UDP-N-acetylmuramoyl-L-alanine--D-glutamate ligase [Clostridia bacterium]|nr:UDP-N-acetylmuramoyl-L-alanine--D-glutamate ligase [Clostridia bacterium]
MEWKGKRVLVIGRGVSGQAVADRLFSLGGEPIWYDDRVAEASGYPQWTRVAVAKGASTLDCAVVSPGVGEDHDVVRLLRSRGVPVLSELDFGYTLCSATVLAVTGTNGKTTVVNLVEKLLSAIGESARAVGNNGIPFSGERWGSGEYAVVETSSFQLVQSRLYRPDYGLITNINIDHIQRHGSVGEYIRAKSRLLDLCRRGYARWLDEEMPEREGLECRTYSLLCSADFCVREGVIYFRDERVLPVREVALLGEHNLVNALSALALASLAVGYRREWKEVLATYRGERMRLECIGEGAPKIFNDSKATNLHAVRAALASMCGTTVLLMGGHDKGESFAAFFATLEDEVRVIAFGESAGRIRKEAEEVGKHDLVLVCADVTTAVRVGLVAGCDNLLFSPGCSSYDAYENYYERGLDFEKAVARYQR